MKKIALFLCTLLAAMFYASGNEVDSLIHQLDQTLLDHKSYMDAKETRINTLKNLCKSSQISKEQEYQLYTQIFNEYRVYNVDSALQYLNLNLELAEMLHKPDWVNETRFHFSRIFSAAGMYKEAMDMLEVIDRKKLLDTQKWNYYACYELLYNELGKYTLSKQIASKYQRIAKSYRDSLLSNIDHSSDDYLRSLEMILLEDGKSNESRKINDILLSKVKEGTPEFALLNYVRAMTYKADHNIYLQKKFLVISATSDIKAAVKDNTSLTLLAAQLYEDKEIDRAYEYIKFALEDANFFNARLRLVQVSNILPLINRAYQTKSENQKAKLRYYLWVISFLSLFTFLAVIYIYKQMKRLADARNNLQNANIQLNHLNLDLHTVNDKLKELNIELLETNTIKEQYIGLFLNICSSYIDKLENYRRMVNKSITSGKVPELYEITKSRQLIENELKEFYDNFDNTFLHIFPNFVDELNTLLVKEEKIILKKGELLNTELRIFALIRLGISDSSKIAGLLRYSVNTIYNYRVKIKNKSSVPREDFESQVMKIGTFSR